MRDNQHESDSWVPDAHPGSGNGRDAKKGGNRNTRVRKAWKPLPAHRSHAITLEEYKRRQDES